MKIIATSDLHMPKYQNKMPGLIQSILAYKADVLLLLGDIAPANDTVFEDFLSRLSDFPGPKLFIPGNHDLWTPDGNSKERYEKILPEICRKHGFHPLDQEPFIHKGIGFVGNIGWYDYSFARVYSPPPNTTFLRSKNVSSQQPLTWDKLGEEDWRRKKVYYKGFLGVIHETGCHDQEYIQNFWEDKECCQIMQDKLEAHMQEIESKVSKIVAAFHCVPFKEALVRNNAEPSVCFRNAYAGSKKMGELLYRHPKTALALWGHVHIRQSFSKGLIKCLNVSFDPNSTNPVMTEI